MKEIRIIMGINASGKTSAVEYYTTKGYQRINRDLTGGDLEFCTEIAKDAFSNGVEKVVLDNTYPTIQSRASLVKLGKSVKAPVYVDWLTTTLEDAQLNACLRMINKTGKLLMPEDFKGQKDPNLFPPAALFHFRKIFEKPTTKEGFTSVLEIPFVRKWPKNYVNKALILDYDGTLRESLGAEGYPTKLSEIKVLKNRTEVLKKYQANGYKLLGVSNQSGIAKGKVSLEIARACFEETNKQLGVSIEYMFCPHRIPPMVCYCRKPSVGLGAYLIASHKLNPVECIMVGDFKTDETFANRCGFQYVDVNHFFE